MPKKLDRYEFIWKSIQKHGYKYDYRKVEYVNDSTKVCVTCPEHGEFWQTPNNHLCGAGCAKCSGNLKSNSEDFINKAKEIHGDKYDYSKSVYNGSKEKLCIICPKHGEFWQRPNSHLNGHACHLCSNEFIGNKKRKSIINFINKAKEIHGDKYDYSKVEYMNGKVNVCIICKEHGEFYQTPDKHINREQGCPKCYGLYKSTDMFVEQSIQIHDNKYDYSKVKYINNHTKVCIICPEHGEFWQRPSSHLQGNGCPICNESKLEIEIAKLFDEKVVIYERQKHFKWLGRQTLDFYLPLHQIGIECQGKQHFAPFSFGSKEKNAANILYEKCIERDERKLKLCKENNIKILYYGDKKYSDKLLNKEELIEKIYERKNN